MALFDTYLPKLLQKEGGYVNDPDDPGGETYCGIARRFHPSWSGWPMIDQIKRTRTIRYNERIPSLDASVKAFYIANFWNPMRADSINSQALAETFVDHGINAGIGRSVRMMQYVLRNLFFRTDVAIDGVIGNFTLAAINGVADQARLFNTFNDMRKAFYAYRANQADRNRAYDSFFASLNVSPSNTARKFYNGWIARVDAFGKKKLS